MESVKSIITLPATSSPMAESAPQLIALAIVVLAVFYLTVLRPAGRDNKRHRALIECLKKNDRVVTAGGVIGLFVTKSEDNREITLQVDEKVRLKFHRNYIVGVLIEDKKDKQ